jgi:hypothetical protein
MLEPENGWKSKRSTVISLLTLASMSWSKEVNADYFSRTVSEVKRARLLKKENVILATPDPKKVETFHRKRSRLLKSFIYQTNIQDLLAGMITYLLDCKMERRKQKFKRGYTIG